MNRANPYSRASDRRFMRWLKHPPELLKEIDDANSGRVLDYLRSLYYTAQFAWHSASVVVSAGLGIIFFNLARSSDWALRLLLEPVRALVPLAASAAVVGLVCYPYVFVAYRRRIEFRAIRQLTRLLILFSDHKNQFNTAGFRRTANDCIRRFANEIERFPIAYGGRDPEIARRALRVAAGVRHWQIAVAMPSDSSYGDIANTAEDSLLLMMNGRWHRVSDAEPDPDGGLSRIAKGFYVGLGLLSFALIVPIGLFASYLSWGTGFAVTGAVTLGLTFLIKAGVAPGGIQQVVDLANSVTKGAANGTAR